MQLIRDNPVTAMFFAFFLASCGFSYLPWVLRWIALGLTVLFLVILLTAKPYNPQMRQSLILICAACTVSGCLIIAAHHHADRLDSLAGETDRVKLRITETEYSLSYAAGYIAAVQESELLPAGTRIRLYSPMTSLPEGAVLEGEIQLSSLSDDGFDGRSYYLPKRIQLAAEDLSLIHTDTASVFSVTSLFRGINQRFTAMIRASTSPSAGGLASAVLLGDRSSLDEAMERDFRRIGISHLLVVSGTHFSVLVTMTGLGLKRLRLRPKMRAVLDEIKSVSKYDCNVLITGDTGVGKEKVANIIQKNSRRRMQPFVKINCASISPNLIESEFFGYEKGAFTGADTKGKIGYFEAADNGIIFLDEVGELPMDMQAKLLRVIQDGEFLKVGGTTPVKTDVRIISATNKDLEDLVEKRIFRRDLYYRLNVFPIRVPALDERPEDIAHLTDSFIRKYNEKFGMNKFMDDEAKENLASHKWPGNIRELENVVQRLLIASSGDAITVIDVVKELDGNLMGGVETSIPSEANEESGVDLTSMVEAFEKNIIREACEKYGSTRKAAKAIGISQTQFVRKKNKYGL